MIHFFSFFPFLELSFMNLNPLYYLPSQKNNKKKYQQIIEIDINGISDRLEMCKNIISR